MDFVTHLKKAIVASILADYRLVEAEANNSSPIFGAKLLVLCLCLSEVAGLSK